MFMYSPKTLFETSKIRCRKLKGQETSDKKETICQRDICDGMLEVGLYIVLEFKKFEDKGLIYCLYNFEYIWI
jgi:hypothetical protein